MSPSKDAGVVYIRVSEFGPVQRFLDYMQDEFYPRLNTEAPHLKTDLEQALGQLFADIADIRLGGDES